jgi:hypothetical protein
VHDADLGPRRFRVLGGIGQRLGGDVVGGHLDRLLEPLTVEVDAQVDGDGGAQRQRVQRRAESVL